MLRVSRLAQQTAANQNVHILDDGTIWEAMRSTLSSLFSHVLGEEGISAQPFHLPRKATLPSNLGRSDLNAKANRGTQTNML